MDKQQLIIAIIASVDSSSNKPNMLQDEDFVVHPDGEWIKQNEGYVWRTLWRSMRIMTFSAFSTGKGIPVNLRLQLMQEDQARYNKEMEKMQQELDVMTRYSIVTTPEYRLVRYANQRAEEIIRGSERIFITTT